jgi:hypothetical protein
MQRSYARGSQEYFRLSHENRYWKETNSNGEKEERELMQFDLMTIISQKSYYLGFERNTGGFIL